MSIEFQAAGWKFRISWIGMDLLPTNAGARRGVGNRIRRAITAWLVSLVLLVTVAFASAQNPYQAEVLAWRADHEAKLKADDGWLTVIGLFWLKEGLNRVGTSKGSEILLPAGSAPTKVGVIEFAKGKAIFRAAEGVQANLNGSPIRESEVRSDEQEKPDVLAVADLSLLLLKRGDRYAIRVKDKNSRARAGFTHLKWFPIRQDLRVTGSFLPHTEVREVRIVNILGQVETMKSPGTVAFNINGQEHTLEPVTTNGGKRLFFIFRDLTTGKTTYPAGRYLYSDLPKEGRVTLDFNQAISPPCAFTRFATCPLPPKQNHLKLAIEAGEKIFGAPKHELDGL